MSGGTTHRFKCPNCGGKIRIRNSVEQHPLLRAMYLQCTNVNCGATYRAGLEITHLMSPSAMPNPNIVLPIADNFIRQMAMQKESDRQIDIDDILNAEQA
jgi:predicted RNA-binding Zn-ribbon protein involved in translation (DUF1610 family)